MAAPALADMTYSAADKAVVKGYVLTEGKLARFLAATRAMKRDKRTNAALAREMSSGHATTLAALHAAARTHPISMGYYTKAGLSENDAILIPVAMSNAMVVSMAPQLGGQLPTTSAQIAFTKAHMAQMKELSSD
jgi:hypothetical protein